MSEILPYIKDTVPIEVENQEKVVETNENDEKIDENSGKDGKREITSFTFEQVNDNADELIELRGEGRYFGVTDASSGKTVNNLQSLGPLCANCHKRGHIRAKCKTVVCHKCGVVGDHYEAQCPTTMICSRCGVKGHMASDCQAKQRKKQYCKSCDTFSHSDYNCPLIWRCYIMKKSPISKLPIIYCYNCGSNNHYGDECNQERTSRIPNYGSAFSGSNLPKELRALYYERFKKSNNTSNNKNITNNNNNYNTNNNNNNNNNNNHKLQSSYSGGYFNGYNDSRIYDNTDYYERFNNSRNYNNNNSNFNNGYNRNGNLPTHNKSSNQNDRNYNSRNYQNYNNQSNVKKPSRSGYIERNVPHRSGYIAKPTKSGLIESKKRKHMRY